MDRQTAVILEGIFGGVLALFIVLWFFLVVVPAIPLIPDFGAFFYSIFWNGYFFWIIIFAIPADIFSRIKKNIDARPAQMYPAQVMPRLQQQQQQQQQVIQVNIPPPLPPDQYYATASPPPPQPRSPSIPPTGTVFCIACGSQNVKFAKFCKVCGATIE